MGTSEMLANRWRPTTFGDVVGQEGEVAVLQRVVTASWKPNAIMFTGPFGTGKTSLARLLARALLCDRRSYSRAQLKAEEGLRGAPTEPCGRCESCRAMGEDSHPNYTEVDAASRGSVADIRILKDEVSYRSGDKIKILTLDESHQCSHAAQNALLQTLEEGVQGVLFMFATTEANRMLPTVRSRCVELQLNLLTTGQIERRLSQICEGEAIQHEGKALRIIATYARGHARDAIVLLEQLGRVANPVSEELVRSYLKLDKHTEVYKLLCEEDRKAGFEQLEKLLCNYAPSELTEAIGETFLNAYKLTIGIEENTAMDNAWLKRIAEKREPAHLLDLAEQILTTPTDYGTINQALAGLGNRLFGKTNTQPTQKQALQPSIPAQFRKQRQP